MTAVEIVLVALVLVWPIILAGVFIAAYAWLFKAMDKRRDEKASRSLPIDSPPPRKTISLSDPIVTKRMEARIARGDEDVWTVMINEIDTKREHAILKLRKEVADDLIKAGMKNRKEGGPL